MPFLRCDIVPMCVLVSHPRSEFITRTVLKAHVPDCNQLPIACFLTILMRIKLKDGGCLRGCRLLFDGGGFAILGRMVQVIWGVELVMKAGRLEVVSTGGTEGEFPGGEQLTFAGRGRGQSQSTRSWHCCCCLRRLFCLPPGTLFYGCLSCIVHISHQSLRRAHVKELPTAGCLKESEKRVTPTGSAYQ